MSALTESNSDLIHIVWIQDGQQNKNQQQNYVYKYSDEKCLFYYGTSGYRFETFTVASFFWFKINLLELFGRVISAELCDA